MRDITRELFDRKIKLKTEQFFISPIVLGELNNTSSDTLKEKLQKLLEKYPFEELFPKPEETNKLEFLARNYIEEGVIPEKKIVDAFHVAYATFYQCDILISWNFRHLANVKKNKLVTNVNFSLGYEKKLLMITPFEVLYE